MRYAIVMIQRSRYWLLRCMLAAVFLSRVCYGQINETRFEHISLEQGLSQTTVFSVFQDSKGFLWFGTLDGLNKYDGYSIIVFRSDPRNPKTISNNSVFKIFEDNTGALWIGTLGGGLNRFDRATEQFKRFRHAPGDSTSLSNDFVRSIFQDRAGRLWIGTNNGLNLYDRGKNSFHHYVHADGRNSLSNNYVWAIHESTAEPGVLWLGTYDGLNRYDLRNGIFTVFRSDSANNHSLSNNYVWSIVEQSDSTLWIGTNKGLNLFNKRTGRSIRFLASPEKRSGIGGNNVWSLCPDGKGSLYVGTLGSGLDKLLQASDVHSSIAAKFLHYEHDPANPNSLSQNFVWSMLRDNTGVIWIGTDGGLNKLDPEMEKFAHYRSVPYNPNSLSNSEVTALCKTQSGILWVGTKDGLNRYDAAKDGFVHYRSSVGDPSSLGGNFVRALLEDHGGNLWIGTSGGGLSKLSPSKSGFTRLQAGPLPRNLSSNDITSLLEDDDGILWIGTLSGLNRYDPHKGSIRIFQHDAANFLSLSHDYVSTMYETRDGALWVGTFGGGLNQFHRENGTFTRIMERPGDTTSLSDNNVWCLNEDSTGALWIGTNNGLDRFDRARNLFVHYDERRGLINTGIYGILQDNRGNLWMSSNKGLTCFNPQTDAIRTYGASDGLQSNQFSGNAYFKDPQGMMYFGGINGYNAFLPDGIRDNPHIPPIVLTDFQIFNKSVSIAEGSPLQSSITETKTVHLSYGQNVFSFEFAALHYASPAANQYAYKMEGFDHDWIRSGTRRYATYTNLDPGTYTFRVIGSNNDGVWNMNGTSLTVVIAPPFWKTWWFISGLMVIVLSIVAAIIYFQIRHLLAMERLRLKIAADLHDDIGTRLTEISLLSDMIYHVDSGDRSSFRESVHNIGQIARALIESMSDIVWLINPERDSLYELFLKLKDTYEEILSYKQINFHINNLESLKNVTLAMDYRKNIYLIYKEAMNNAIKYSGCTEMSINTELHGGSLSITLYDNGRGFDASLHSLGNGLRDMENRAKECGGQLRIQSKPGEGTIIRYSGKT